ncbi:MAG: glycosyltransferase family 4 protein [Bacteroidota bacterium]|nr:glycosyltransferase family 4 protein [Bacteroidota bacterium]
MSKQKINVLVIPDLFPKFKGDVQGIFVIDYLASTQTQCNNTVLFGRVYGEKKGLLIEKLLNYELYRYVLSSKKIKFLLKPFYYILWFVKGYQIGKSFRNIDIIHAHGTILSGTLSWLLSKKLKVPFIITEHQGPFTMTSENFWKRNWTKFIMEKTNAVLTVSNHLKHEILGTNIHPKQIIVTYNPVDTDLFQIKSNKLNKTILFVGRLDNFKGAFRCLQAFALIHQHYPDWKFTIVGDGQDYQAISSYLKGQPHLATKLRLTGQLNKDQIAQEMQASDFLVFPSKHESFGLVVAEALSCGLPVIVGNTTAPKEFVNDKNGILVDYDNIPQIGNGMEQMIKRLSVYNSSSIREDIITQFGFDNFGKKLVNIYQSFLK